LHTVLWKKNVELQYSKASVLGGNILEKTLKQTEKEERKKECECVCVCVAYIHLAQIGRASLYRQR